jgi:hypothetical protein
MVEAIYGLDHRFGHIVLKDRLGFETESVCRNDIQGSIYMFIRLKATFITSRTVDQT